MIAEEEDNLLMHTGKGTPCGELMRRYWQPCVLSGELGADKPLPVTIFGEEMILFRDGAGKPAMIGRYCAHQGVDMIYGRVEPDGLRCMYHGWLFDPCGKVLLRGEWLPGKERRWDVGQPSYPAMEIGGVIFTYMGPGDPPALPALFSSSAAPIEIATSQREQNYWQGMSDLPEVTRADSRFWVPNLVNAAAVLRWFVPVDDATHVQFVFRCPDGGLPGGEPLKDAAATLRQAIRDLAIATPS
ncbi:MAG: Rieske 2Fe-2S domain-containing protein [Deltaproteobacteria bacterium]|nr:Rieske 2Fe-2S domain-containing protein [Deltaproteobacteria bacterium]